MEIVVERIAKKETYTIGRLYLLADGDVKRKACLLYTSPSPRD